MRFVKSILLLLFIVAVVVFTTQNMEIVRVRFLNWHLEMPLAIASVLTYVIGAISGGIIFSIIKILSAQGKHTNKKTVKETET